MIKALERLEKATKNYNPITGIGANELLKAVLHFQKKLREVDDALERVDKILEANKNGR